MIHSLLSPCAGRVREPGPADARALAPFLAEQPRATRALRAPAGERRCIIAVDRRGALAACALGLVRPVVVGGERRSWTQIVALVVRPDLCRGLGRTGPALAVAEAFQERFCRPQQGAVLYALPSRGVERLATRRLDWDVVHEVDLLVAHPGRLTEAAGDSALLEEVQAFPQEVDRLGARAARRHVALLARDRTLLDARFGSYAGGQHRIALVRRGERLVGYAVARTGQDSRAPNAIAGPELAGDRPLRVVDWLLDPEEEREGTGGDGAGRVLRAWLGRTARRLQATSIIALLPECCASYAAFQRGGFRVRATGDVLIARSLERPRDAAWLHAHWYCTLADFDQM